MERKTKKPPRMGGLLVCTCDRMPDRITPSMHLMESNQLHNHLEFYALIDVVSIPIFSVFGARERTLSTKIVGSSLRIFNLPLTATH